jgi:hypothetical protein
VTSEPYFDVECLRALIEDPPFQVLPLGVFTSVTVQPILRGEIVELSISSEADGDQDAWLTPAEAYDLATALMDSADLAEAGKVAR